MKLKRLRFFYQFLISYLLLLLIPLLILGISFIYTVDINYKKTVNKDTKSQLDLFLSDLTHETERFNEIVNQLRIQGFLQENYVFENDPLHANNIKQAFISIVITSPFYEDIFFYQINSPYIISASSTYGKNLFINSFYDLKQSDSKSFEQVLNEIDKPVTLLLEKKRTTDKTIAYCYPINNGKGENYGILMFLFSNGKFSKYIKNRIDINKTYMELKSKDGISIITSGEKKDKSSLDYNYSIPLVDWEILFSVSNTNSLIQSLREHIFLFSILLFAILILSFFVIVYYMKKNYLPLASLHEKAIELGYYNEGKRNEYESIDVTMTGLTNKNKTLQDEVSRLTKSHINIELQKLITGGYYNSIEEFNTTNKGLLKIEGEFFFLLYIMVDKPCNDITSFVSRMKNQLDTFSYIYYVFTPFPQRLYFIFNLSNLNIFEKLKTEIEKTRLILEEEFNVDITIGVSTINNDISNIPSLFLEAKNASDYCFVKGKRKTIFFEETCIKNDSSYPENDMKNLKKAILSKNEDQIEVNLSNFVKYLEENNLSLFVAKGLCFDILRTYIIANTNLDIKAKLEKEIIELSEAETATELVNSIKNKIKGNSKAKPEANGPSKLLIKSINKYINENYMNCNFSLSDVADYVNINVSKLSIIYKKSTGEYLVDYVSKLRIAKAKKLLEETDLTIKDISQHVGYYNVSSFIRRFRQLQGIPPNDYRRIIKTE